MKLAHRLTRPLLPIYQDAIRKTHDLNYLFFELTHDCNLACRHCGSDCIQQENQPILPATKVLEVLDEIRGRFAPAGILVVLSGGEPLCYPGLFELGAQITGLGFPWGMVTNGFGWTPRKIARARAAGLASITVSLDGEPASHDWLRGHQGSQRRALQTIGWLARERFWRAMDVITCVNKRNLGELDRMRRLLIDLGVPGWRLFTISPIGRA